MDVVILAGGLGTRLSEYTDKIPKPMVPIGGRPILWHIMQRYAQYGYKSFDIEDYFEIHFKYINLELPTPVEENEWQSSCVAGE